METSFSDLCTRDTMTTMQFDAMMEKGLNQAKAGQGIDLEDAFASIIKKDPSTAK